MIRAKTAVLVLLASLLFFIYPQISNGADKNKDYLELPQAELEMMIFGAVDMAGHIAFLEDEDRGVCIWNWLKEDIQRKKALVIQSMEKYPEEAPTSIVIALVERECGKFPRSEPRDDY